MLFCFSVPQKNSKINRPLYCRYTLIGRSTIIRTQKSTPPLHSQSTPCLAHIHRNLKKISNQPEHQKNKNTHHTHSIQIWVCTRPNFQILKYEMQAYIYLHYFVAVLKLTTAGLAFLYSKIEHQPKLKQRKTDDVCMEG